MVAFEPPVYGRKPWMTAASRGETIGANQGLIQALFKNHSLEISADYLFRYIEKCVHVLFGIFVFAFSSIRLKSSGVRFKFSDSKELFQARAFISKSSYID